MDEDLSTQVMDSGQDLVSQAGSHRSRGCLSFHKEEKRKAALGLVLVFAIAFSWVGSQQFAQTAVSSENFNAPYFTVWFSTSWLTLCFPGYCLFVFLTHKRSEFWSALRESRSIFSEDATGWCELVAKTFGFVLMYVGTNYAYVYALSYIASTDASAIISSNVVIVYLMSLFLLGERLYVIRIFATCLCISGVVLFAYADGYGSTSNVTGVLLAILSAFGSAAYKVIFKKALWKGTLGQVCLFLSILALLNVLIMWSVMVALYVTGVERFTADVIPWEYLCGSSSLSLVFNFLVNFGVAYTYPLYIAIAMMLGIPFNALIDFLVREVDFSAIRLVAALLIISGFIVTMFPTSWNFPLHRALSCCGLLPRCDVTSPDDDDDDDVTAAGDDVEKSARYTRGVKKDCKIERF